MIYRQFNEKSKKYIIFLIFCINIIHIDCEIPRIRDPGSGIWDPESGNPASK